jgi:hypothetical protein
MRELATERGIAVVDARDRADLRRYHGPTGSDLSAVVKPLTLRLGTADRLLSGLATFRPVTGIQYQAASYVCLLKFSQAQVCPSGRYPTSRGAG